MAKKFTESPATMVYSILEDHKGQFLTAREIFSEIYKKFFCSIAPETIKNSIYELIALSKPIETTIHQCGEKRIPTAVFKLNNHTIKIESCSE